MSARSLTQVAMAANPVNAANILTARFAGGVAKGGVSGGANTVAGDVTGQDPESAAVKAAKKLEEENRARLAREAADRAEGKRRAETSGQRAGFGAAGFGGIFSGAGSSRSRARGSLFGN